MTTVTIKSGSEGPCHDPYHYEEITVQRPDGRVVVYHEGLGIWAEANDGAAVDRTKEDAAALFERYAGVSVRALKRAMHKAHERKFTRHPCGMSHMKDVNGYPGETLTVCGKCGAVIDNHFDRSAVE